MKPTKIALFAITFCLALFPGLIAGDSSAKPIFYQLLWNGDNVAGTIFINGFEMATMDGKSGSGSASLNVLLTGENEIRADIKKADGSQPAEFSVGLSKMSPGDIVDTLGKGNAFSIDKKDADFAGGKTLTITKKFTSTLDFSGHLAKAQNADDKEIIAYAVKIHGLFAKKDAAGIVKEFSLKLDDYDSAFSTSGSAAEFKSILENELLKGKLEKLDAAKLKIIKEGPGGNVKRVVCGSHELIKLAFPDGSTMEITVYIGKIDGVLKVVR